MSYLTDTGSPIRWEKLATWWADCSHDLHGHSSENWPQGNREQWTLELKSNCTWNNQEDTDQTTDDQFQDDVGADCAVSACRPLPQPIKALAPWLSVGGFGLWTRVPPSLPIPNCWHLKLSKRFCPSTWLLYWLLRGEHRTPVSVMLLQLGIWDKGCQDPHGCIPATPEMQYEQSQLLWLKTTVVTPSTFYLEKF